MEIGVQEKLTLEMSFVPFLRPLPPPNHSSLPGCEVSAEVREVLPRPKTQCKFPFSRWRALSGDELLAFEELQAKRPHGRQLALKLPMGFFR
jgi:hypothetical protein